LENEAINLKLIIWRALPLFNHHHGDGMEMVLGTLLSTHSWVIIAPHAIVLGGWAAKVLTTTASIRLEKAAASAATATATVEVVVPL
jgi:hypothetical protein